MLVSNIERAIFDAVSSFEPRVNLDNVEVIASPDENSITITLTYRVLNTLRPITLDISLERTR
jgi:predicted component of type VI protein secretion system